MVMNACVTTTTGGFNVEPSDEESLENYIQLAVAFENLGRSAVSLDRPEEAEVAFTRALQLNSNLYISSIELALLRFQRGDWPGARQAFRQYFTTTEFYSLPHTPRALLAGITIEGRFNNQKLVDDFTRILTTLYQDSPKYAELQQRMTDAN